MPLQPELFSAPASGASPRAPARLRRALIIFALSTALWLTVGAITFLQTLWIGVAGARMAAPLSLLEWGPWILFSPMVIFVTARLPITGANWKLSVPLHLGCSFAVAVAVNGLTLAVSRIWLPGVARGVAVMAQPPPEPPDQLEGAEPAPRNERFQPRPTIVAGGPGAFELPIPRRHSAPLTPPALGSVLLLNARLTLPIYWLIVVAVLAHRHHRIALEREGRALRAERELVRARLAALQSQLQPHFLFNSLNAISAFIAQRPAAAEEMVCALSDLLRRVLQLSDRPEIALHEELAFARGYLAVHAIRFSDSLRVSWKINPAAHDALVPTLVLQPLIENALDHGLRGAPGEIEIAARIDRSAVQLAVTNRSDDPLPAEATPPGHGVGLRNTRERLATLFGNDYRLELQEIPGGARTEIEFPYRAAPPTP